MSQARELVLKAVTVLLCGRSISDEPSHRNASAPSLANIPLPTVPRAKLPASMQQYTQYTPAPLYAHTEDQAINAALAQSLIDQAAWEATRGSGSALQGRQAPVQQNAGEALSHKLWRDGSLGFTDVITDGFYDIHGDYPEICEGDEFPSIDKLRNVRIASDDEREVILVDHELDNGLLRVESALADAMERLGKPQDVVARIKVVAKTVSDCFGGTFEGESSLELFWQVQSAQQKGLTSSAVVFLCELKVGALRHRALLFKLLADNLKIPCKLLRGPELCGCYGAADVVVFMGGQEMVVDLVDKPGLLLSMQEYKSRVHMRRSRVSSWQRPPPLSSVISAVEHYAVSASSTSSASTAAHRPLSGSVPAIPPPASGPATVQNMPAASEPPAHSSPRSLSSRSHVAVPPVPPPGVYSSSIPSSGPLHAVPGASNWGLGSSGQHGNPPAIAGNRVRFTITERPKGHGSGSQGQTAQAGTGAQGMHGAPRDARAATVPAPLPPPNPPTAQAVMALNANGRHSSNALPSKTRSMGDLGVPQLSVDGSQGSEIVGTDLIRLDSEPLPDMAFHGGLEPLPLPERSNTPTGGQVPSRVPGVPHRRQNSLDKNGWVKFSGSFSQNREDAGRPGGATGPSPLSQQHGATHGDRRGAAHQPLDTIHSFTAICAAPSPNNSGGRSSLSPECRGAADSSSGSLPAVVLSGAGGGLSSASAFANFQLPPGLATAVPGAAGNGPSNGELAGTGPPTAAGDGAGGGGRTSNPMHRPGGQTQALQNQPPRPDPHAAAQPTPATSPFQIMQVGYCAAGGGMSPALAAAFPGMAQQTGGRSTPQMPLPTGGIMAGAGGAGVGPQSQLGPNSVPMPRLSSYATPQPLHPQQQQGPVRQAAVGSADSGPKYYMQHTGGSTSGAGNGGGGMYNTPAKSVDGGSKVPSPSLSTPFSLPASSAQSTPQPGSAPPAGNVPFADLSPFNHGEAAGTAVSTTAVTNSGQRERDKERERDRERDRGERERERAAAQSFFADLSPFARGSASGVDATRDTTPARGATPPHSSSGGGGGSQQPIVEMPSSDNSRDTTPRVSYSNVGDQQLLPSSQGSTGTEVQTLDLARMRLTGPSPRPSRFMDPPGGAGGGLSQGHLMLQPPPPHNHMGQRMQMQPYSGMPMGQAVYYAALQTGGNPYMYNLHQQQQQQALAAAAGMGLMPHHGQQFAPQMGAGVAAGSHPGWRPQFDGGWANAWVTQHQQHHQQHHQPHHQQQQLQQQHQQLQQHQQQHQQQQLMMQAAYYQQQQQQQLALVAAGMTGGSMGAGVERRTSVNTTTNVVRTHVLEPTSGSGPTAPPLPAGGPHPHLPSTSPQHAHPHAPQPPHPAPPQPAQQQPLDSPRPQLPSQPHPPPQQQPGPQPGAGPSFSHEMTIPSQQRLAELQAQRYQQGARGSDAGGGGGAYNGPIQPALDMQASVSMSMPLPPSYKDLEIDPEELKYEKRIGMGSYGEVFKGTWRGTDVAIKRFLEQNLSPSIIREFRGEVMIMSKLRHPNIVLFMGAVTRSNQLAIVTQFVQRGSLFHLLHRSPSELDPRRRLSMALDIAKGMEYLHHCKPVLVHRDLKSPNLLVDRDWTVKVCDFGLSQVKMNTFLTAKTQGGSPAWMAPEILRGEPCDEKSDVFSFGVILYEIVTGREPWDDLNPMQVVGAVGFAGKRMTLPTDLEPAVTALIQRCWENRPADRPSFTEILAIMTAWSELRPTATVMQEVAAARARKQRPAP